MQLRCKQQVGGRRKGACTCKHEFALLESLHSHVLSSPTAPAPAPCTQQGQPVRLSKACRRIPRRRAAVRNRWRGSAACSALPCLPALHKPLARNALTAPSLTRSPPEVPGRLAAPFSAFLHLLASTSTPCGSSRETLHPQHDQHDVQRRPTASDARLRRRAETRSIPTSSQQDARCPASAAQDQCLPGVEQAQMLLECAQLTSVAEARLARPIEPSCAGERVSFRGARGSLAVVAARRRCVPCLRGCAAADSLRAAVDAPRLLAPLPHPAITASPALSSSVRADPGAGDCNPRNSPTKHCQLGAQPRPSSLPAAMPSSSSLSSSPAAVPPTRPSPYSRTASHRPRSRTSTLPPDPALASIGAIYIGWGKGQKDPAPLCGAKGRGRVPGEMAAGWLSRASCTACAPGDAALMQLTLLCHNRRAWACGSVPCAT